MGPDSTARGFPWEGGAYQGGSREGHSVWDEKPGFLLKNMTVWGILDWIADRGIQMHTCTYGFEKTFCTVNVKMLCQKLHDYITDVCTQMEWKLHVINKHNIVSQTCSVQSTCVNVLWQVMEGFFSLQLFLSNICIWVMVSALCQAYSDAPLTMWAPPGYKGHGIMGH